MTVPTRTRRAYLAVGVVVPLAATLAAVVLQLVWLPRMPDPIAVHWSSAGPDGFGPLWLLALLTLAVGVGLTLLSGVIVRAGLVRGEWTTTQRLFGALTAGFVVFLAVALTWSAGMQLDLADAADGPNGLIPQLAGAAAGVPIAVLSWFVLPAGRPKTDQVAAPATPLPLSDGERVTWLRTAAMSRPTLALTLGATMVAAGCAIATASVDPVIAAIVAVVTLALGALVAATTVFRVRVDPAGLTVRSLLGVPRFRVPTAEIVSAAAVEVDPLSEFGGWGMRWGSGGRFGVVVRRGTALEVRRTNGRSFVVTVDDAATAASVLQALAARTQPAA